MTAQSTWKKSTASMLVAWVCRNWRQLVSVCRIGAGGMRWRFRIRRIVEAPMSVAECEQLALEPLVSPSGVLPRHPHDQRGERVVDRWSSGPVRVGPPSADEAAVPAQDRVRGDQAMGRSARGSRWMRAANTARSAQSRRGRWGCGGARRPRAAARGARCPWWRTCGPSVGPTRAPDGRSSTASGATRRDHVRPGRSNPLVSDPCQIGTPQGTCRHRIFHTVEAPIW